jgi:hypothetical protein
LGNSHLLILFQNSVGNSVKINRFQISFANLQKINNLQTYYIPNFMKEKEFIENFFKERSNYNNPEQAINQRELGEKYANHDFEVVHNGKTILIEAKATTWGEENGTDFSISKNEWQLLASTENDYIIARVFNARTSVSVKWLKVAHVRFLV